MAADERGTPCTAGSLPARGGIATTPTRPRARIVADSAARRRRVLNVSATLAAAISAILIVVGFFARPVLWWVQVISLVAAVIFAVVPLLHRFGELVGPLTFFGTAYAAIFINCAALGTGSGLQFFFLVAACLVVLLLGIDRIGLAAALAAVAAGLVITLEFLVPRDTGLKPAWVQSLGFVLTTVSACVMVVVTVWYALRDAARAEAAREREYQRSEALLANIMPASIADRLKDPTHGIIADRYDEASVLFADIADFTEKASDMAPDTLIRFLDRVYSAFDALVERHGLEKIKVSGDSYMVVSGVPHPRPDHLEALAALALDMADAAGRLQDADGNGLPLRIGLATGPVVAGVVGSRRFFYDVWGDAVNVASRMQATDSIGRIHVPEAVYERLKNDFVLQERGAVQVKGKGVMRTWYLVGRKDDTGWAGPLAAAPNDASRQRAAGNRAR